MRGGGLGVAKVWGLGPCGFRVKDLRLVVLDLGLRALSLRCTAQGLESGVLRMSGQSWRDVIMRHTGIANPKEVTKLFRFQMFGAKTSSIFGSLGPQGTSRCINDVVFLRLEAVRCRDLVAESLGARSFPLSTLEE